MINSSLLEAGAFSLISTGAAAGQTDHDSDTVDMQGYDSCLFITVFGAIDATATPRVAIHDSATDAVGTVITATQQTITATDDDKLVIHDCIRPKKRYLAVRVERDVVAADSTVDCIIAIRYNARDGIVSQASAEVAASSVYISPGN